MAHLNSWEDDKDVTDEQNLSEQAQRSLNLGAAPNLNPASTTFRPGATTFQPQQYQQQYPPQQGGYGAGYNYGMQFPQYGGYNQQPQYGQGMYQQPQYQQLQPQQNWAQNQQPQSVPAHAAPPSSSAQSNPLGSTAPKVKVLSIGSDAPKVQQTGGVKTLTIDSSDTAKPKASTPKPESADKPATPKPGQTADRPQNADDKPGPASSSKPAAKANADAVAKEQITEVDEETLAAVYGKEACSIVFLGHVDSGKSTLGGSILYATGMVDQRTLDKYKREAKDAGRETWFLSWALDLTSQERAKGKTVELGRAFFETDRRRYTILDAPGHKTFTPQAISGAALADVGVLVISARRGEYETGFERAGQTREHAVLAKTQGVNKLVVVVNKMDDPTVQWSQDRFTECSTKLSTFLKGVGYNPKTDLKFMPISAQAGMGVKDRIPSDVCPWYQGPSLLEYLDSMTALERKVNAPFMMPIASKYRDLGTMVEGKIEAGVIKKDGTYLMMPNREKITVATLYGETEDEIEAAQAGEQVRIRVRGVEEEDILPGFVLCAPKRPVHCVSKFEAQIVFLDLRSIISAGYNCVLHVHSMTEEVTFGALLHSLQKGTNRKSKKPPPFAKRGMSVIARLEVIGTNLLCIERFEDYPQMGRFTLRDQGQTIGIGKVTKLITEESEAAEAAAASASAAVARAA